MLGLEEELQCIEINKSAPALLAILALSPNSMNWLSFRVKKLLQRQDVFL